MRSKGAQRKNALTDNTNFLRAKYTVKQVVITNFATLRFKIPSGSLVNPTGSRKDLSLEESITQVVFSFLL